MRLLQANGPSAEETAKLQQLHEALLQAKDRDGRLGGSQYSAQTHPCAALSKAEERRSPGRKADPGPYILAPTVWRLDFVQRASVLLLSQRNETVCQRRPTESMQIPTDDEVSGERAGPAGQPIASSASSGTQTAASGSRQPGPILASGSRPTSIRFEGITKAFNEIATDLQTSDDIDRLLSADPCTLARIARSRTISELHHVFMTLSNINADSKRGIVISALHRPGPLTDTAEPIQFPGMLALLGQTFNPNVSGVSVNRSETRQWASKEQWADEQVAKTLPADKGLRSDTLAKYAKHIAEFGSDCHDQQILVELSNSRAYLRYACGKLSARWGATADGVIDVDLESENAEVRPCSCDVLIPLISQEAGFQHVSPEASLHWSSHASKTLVERHRKYDRR